MQQTFKSIYDILLEHIKLTRSLSQIAKELELDINYETMEEKLLDDTLYGIIKENLGLTEKFYSFYFV